MAIDPISKRETNQSLSRRRLLTPGSRPGQALRAASQRTPRPCGWRQLPWPVNEQRVYGDSAYASQKDLIASKAPSAKDFTNQRTRYAGIVDEAVRAKNRNKSRIRSRVEHVFGVVKRLWEFGKVRYRGLHKNATRAFTALALDNIYLARQRLMAQVRP